MGAWLSTLNTARALAHMLRGGSVAAGSNKPAAFFEVGRKPLWTAGRNTLIDDVMKRAALANTARGVNGYQQYSLETLLASQPSFYVVTTGRVNAALRPGQAEFAKADPELFARERNRVLTELLREPVLKRLRSVQRGRVIVVPADWVLRPGPRLANGINELRSQQRVFDAQVAKETDSSRRN